jgi:hypothetical protein
LRHLDEFFVRSGRARDKHGGAEAGIDQEIAHQSPPCDKHWPTDAGVTVTAAR